MKIGQMVVSYSFKEHIGPTFNFAGISIRLEWAPETKICFRNVEITEEFKNPIVNGILDGLLDIELDPDENVLATVLSVEEHEAHSNACSFYLASRIAVSSRKSLETMKYQFDPKEH